MYETSHSDYPWLTRQANEILQSWLRKTDVGLEWGAGRSTVWFSKRVANLTSVEHDLVWYEKVKAQIAVHGIGNVHLCPIKLPLTLDKSQSNPYVAIVDSFPNNGLDFVLVDGKYRIECTFKVLNKIKPGGLLIIDNINLFLPSDSHSPNSRNKCAGPSSKEWLLLANMLSSWRCMCIWTSNGVNDTAIWVKPA